MTVRPTIEVRQSGDPAAMRHAMRHAMWLLQRHEVLVGIPAGMDARKEDEPIGNAAIGYIHEHGSPEANIPARPFLRPGIAAAQDGIREWLAAGARAALRGDGHGVLAALDAAGQLARNSVQARFSANDWAALAPATLAARWRAENPAPPPREGQKRRGRRKTGTPTKPNPLVSSGALRDAIVSVVRRRGQ